MPEIPSVDPAHQLPPAVRERLALNFEDPASPEGAALGRTIDVETKRTAKRGITQDRDAFGFHIGLAKRKTARQPIIYLDDSTGEGVGSASLLTRIIARANTAVRSKAGTAAKGGLGYRAARTGAYAATTGLSPTTSGTVTNGDRGLGHRSVALGSGGSITFPHTQFSQTHTSDRFEILFYGTGTVDILINGVTTSYTLAGGANGYSLWTGTALTSAKYDVVITRTAGTPEVCGIFDWDGDYAQGVTIIDGSRAGAKAADFVASAGGSDEWAEALSDAGITPSAITIGFLLNDAISTGGNRTATQYKADVQALITAVRARWAGVPIFLLGKYRRATAAVSAWDDYYAALGEIADAGTDIAFVNLDERIRSVGLDGAHIFTSDQVHPNDVGCTIIGSMVGNAVAPYMIEPPSTPAVVSSAFATEVTAPGAVFGPNGAQTLCALTGAAGATRDLIWRTSGVDRWVMRATLDAESGSNGGTNLTLISRDDAGAALFTYFTLNRRFNIWGWGDGMSMAAGTGSGLKIGNATNQKIGFWNATPVVQPAKPTDLAGVIALLAQLGLCAP